MLVLHSVLPSLNLLSQSFNWAQKLPGRASSVCCASLLLVEVGGSEFAAYIGDQSGYRQRGDYVSYVSTQFL